MREKERTRDNCNFYKDFLQKRTTPKEERSLLSLSSSFPLFQIPVAASLTE